jgi:hypothetical protein
VCEISWITSEELYTRKHKTRAPGMSFLSMKFYMHFGGKIEFFIVFFVNLLYLTGAYEL